MHYDQHFPRLCALQAPGCFTRFQRLPPEIRNMIWEFALPEPRVYEVLDAPNAKQQTPAQEGLMFANVHAEAPPALAAVCRESRSLVLHHYKPLTLGKTTKFVDMSRDILLLEPYLLVKRLHRVLHFMSQIPLVRENAAHLALGTSYGIYQGIFHPVLSRKVSKNNMGKLLASLAEFPRLRTLIFIVHQEFQFQFDFRFPGTLTPMLPGPTAAASDFGLAPDSGSATAGYSSPVPSNGGPITTTQSTATVGGLPPCPTASTAASSFSPPPLLPLPLPTALQQQRSSPPFLQSYQHQQQPQPPQLNTFNNQPVSVLSPTLNNQPVSVLSPTPDAAQSRPQQVHQAYRFKFDIESNINSRPRRPHTNELLYYPLDVSREGDEFDEYERYVSGGGRSTCDSGCFFYPTSASEMGVGFGTGTGTVTESRTWECAYRPGGSLSGDGSAGGSEGEDGEGGEWCDPWPTNDDWKRFRRRWVRGMVAACLPPPSSSSFGAHGHRDDSGVEEPKGGKGCESWTRKEGKGKGARGRVACLPRWKLKGASLLWRYTKGVGGAQ